LKKIITKLTKQRAQPGAVPGLRSAPKRCENRPSCCAGL